MKKIISLNTYLAIHGIFLWRVFDSIEDGVRCYMRDVKEFNKSNRDYIPIPGKLVPELKDRFGEDIDNKFCFYSFNRDNKIAQKFVRSLLESILSTLP